MRDPRIIRYERMLAENPGKFVWRNPRQMKYFKTDNTFGTIEDAFSDIFLNSDMLLYQMFPQEKFVGAYYGDNVGD